MQTRTLNSTIDRMLTLNRALDQAFSNGGSGRLWVPAMDVAERADAYVVNVELAGVSPEHVELRFEQNVLTIRGHKTAGFDAKEDTTLRVFSAERASGAFERSVRLPEFVDADRIDAAFEHGLLTVTVPKAQAAQPRKIEIRTGGSVPRVEG